MANDQLLDLFSLKGRVALVTGASGDIGAAIAGGLAAAGATMALSGRSVERLERVGAAISGAGHAHMLFPADLAESGAPQRLATHVAEQLGRIDILVNCAGMNRRQPIATVSEENFDAIMSANLRSAFLLSQAVLPHMIAQGGGKIVNIGSLTVTIGLADVSVYGMSKSALAQLTKTMAVEWAQHNIQANCLCPGFIATSLTVPLFANERRREWILSRTPAGRGGTPDDLVGMAILMASRASDFMTGQTVFLDGGLTAGSMW